MANVVFQLEKAEISKGELLLEEDLIENDSFIGLIAHGVAKIENTKRVISVIEKAFTKDGIELSISHNTIVFTEKYVDNHFDKKFKHFKKLIKNISKSDFRRDGELLEDISLAVSNSYDYYFYTDGILIDSDEFLRRVEIGKKYNFGNVFEYFD